MSGAGMTRKDKSIFNDLAAQRRAERRREKKKRAKKQKRRAK